MTKKQPRESYQLSGALAGVATCLAGNTDLKIIQQQAQQAQSAIPRGLAGDQNYIQ